MRRRGFIVGLGGAVVWPLGARAQQSTGRARKLGIMLGVRENDSEAQARVTAIRHELRELGWIEGRNLQIEHRWSQAAGDDQNRAAELLALAPDVILNGSTTALPVFQRDARKIPIVFVQIPDPVSGGFVASLSRPGGAMTGFTSYEYTIGSKWLGLLKESASNVTRVAVLINPFAPTWSVVFRRMETLAPSLGMQLIGAPIRDANEVERAIDEAARETNSGLIVFPGPQSSSSRAQIVAMVAKYRLPAVYPYRYFVASGGVISYGIDTVYLHRQAASYVDRVLRGTKPADLPVQAPIKFELVINLQTARALGLSMPPTLLARADEVIE